MTSYRVLRYEEIDGFRIVSQVGQNRLRMFAQSLELMLFSYHGG